jgi:quercetin dioxygenase-like cupin family protein
MGFLDFSKVALTEFRPGIKSWAQSGEHLTMAIMTIEGDRKDPGHSHGFDQSGIILEGSFHVTIGEEKRILKPGQGYFIPAGIHHAWSTTEGPVKIVDISSKAE